MLVPRRWMSSRWIAGAVVAGLVVGIAASGGTAQARRVGTTAASSVDRGVDASARKAARLATVTAADLGTGWTQYRKAQGFTKTTKANCNTKFGSPLKASDRGFVGPMFTDAAEQSFVYSFAYVFRTKAGAKAFTAARGTQAFFGCQAETDDAAAKQANPDSFVRMGRITDPAIGGPEGLEAFYEEEAGAKNSDGADVVSADYVRYTYRHGRVVSVVLIDTGLPGDAAASEELGTRLTAALTAGAAGIQARLARLSL